MKDHHKKTQALSMRATFSRREATVLSVQGYTTHVVIMFGGYRGRKVGIKKKTKIVRNEPNTITPPMFDFHFCDGGYTCLSHKHLASVNQQFESSRS